MAEPDYDHLLRSNLERVFNERDPARRVAAVAELFVAEPVMFEPDKSIQGRGVIAEVAGALHWTAGPAGKAPVVTGTDAAKIVDGRIAQP